MRNFILAFVLLSFLGCSARYVMDGNRCRDMKNGQYTETKNCKQRTIK